MYQNLPASLPGPCLTLYKFPVRRHQPGGDRARRSESLFFELGGRYPDYRHDLQRRVGDKPLLSLLGKRRRESFKRNLYTQRLRAFEDRLKGNRGRYISDLLSETFPTVLPYFQPESPVCILWGMEGHAGGSATRYNFGPGPKPFNHSKILPKE